MVRSLPKKLNPLILPDGAPSYEDLLSRRRLGKTLLAVKPTQVGLSNSTKPENLGPFEYAHLRAPLPKDLKGSEIFPSHAPQQHPDTYFLMRRSKDGYVSATGMFKIAFPWAKLDEERCEREYLKSREETSEDEIAGNVWISPGFALELAKEYQMYDWVRALIDPTEIIQSPSSRKRITPPPKFELPPLDATPQLPPPTERRRLRSASPSKRSGSPTKRPVSPRKRSVSPRKPRQTRSSREPSVVAATESRESLDETTVPTTESEKVNGTVEPEKKVNGEEKEAKDSKRKTTAFRFRKALTDVDEGPAEDEEEKVDTAAVRDVETTKSTVSVEMPSLLPELPPEADAQKLIAEAKEMVEEAKKEQAESEVAESSEKPAKKRKTDDLSEDEEDEATDAPQRAKRAKVLEDKLKRERVRNRALVGVTAALAIAASIPYFF